MGIATSFNWIIILFGEAFKHGNGLEFCGYVETNAETLCV
jgi:hypothetical protein